MNYVKFYGEALDSFKTNFVELVQLYFSQLPASKKQSLIKTALKNSFAVNKSRNHLISTVTEYSEYQWAICCVAADLASNNLRPKILGNLGFLNEVEKPSYLKEILSDFRSLNLSYEKSEIPMENLMTLAKAKVPVPLINLGVDEKVDCTKELKSYNSLFEIVNSYKIEGAHGLIDFFERSTTLISCYTTIIGKKSPSPENCAQNIFYRNVSVFPRYKELVDNYSSKIFEVIESERDAFNDTNDLCTLLLNLFSQAKALELGIYVVSQINHHLNTNQLDNYYTSDDEMCMVS